MANVIIFDVLTNRAKEYFANVDPAGFLSQPDALVFTDQTEQKADSVASLLSAVPVKYIKKVGNPQIAEMSEAEKITVELESAFQDVNFSRSSAVNALGLHSPNPILLRALADILKDEINILRGWLVSFKAQSAAATSLADFKARVATLPDTPDRTLSQLKTAIINRINSGGVDN